MPPPTPNVHYFQFADDTAFLALGKTIKQINTSLQTTIDAFMQWCKTWRLKLNPTKTQSIVFIPPRKRSRVHKNPERLDIHVNNIRLRPTNTVKYLGVIFDRHLTWRAHLQQISTKAYKRLNMLRKLTGTTWGLNATTVLNTYKVFLRPILTFGHIAWIAADHNHYRKIKILERHAARIAYRIKLPSPTQELYNRLPCLFPIFSSTYSLSASNISQTDTKKTIHCFKKHST